MHSDTLKTPVGAASAEMTPIHLIPTFCAAIGLTAGLSLAMLASAQTPAPDVGSAQEAEAPPAVDEVVVRGRRMSEIESDLRIHAGKFVEEVAKPPAGRGYARWHKRVCIGVHNLRPDAAQYIVDRISQVAAELGLDPGEPGCNPNVVVIFTAAGKETATYIAEHYPALLRPSGEGGRQLGLAALQEFEASDRAVRWWHVSMPVDARHGTPAGRLPQDEQRAPVVSVSGPSRIHSGIRDDMRLALIVVDGKKLTGATWQQLADYLAVVSLAQIEPATNPAAFDSILNLFNNPAAYSGLTDWDRSYLHALYAFDQERMPRLQVNELESEMVDQAFDRGQ
jgi:hypothetical protein